MYVCVYMYMYVCVCIYIYIYIYVCLPKVPFPFFQCLSVCVSDMSVTPSPYGNVSLPFGHCSNFLFRTWFLVLSLSFVKYVRSTSYLNRVKYKWLNKVTDLWQPRVNWKLFLGKQGPCSINIITNISCVCLLIHLLRYLALHSLKCVFLSIITYCLLLMDCFVVLTQLE